MVRKEKENALKVPRLLKVYGKILLREYVSVDEEENVEEKLLYRNSQRSNEEKSLYVQVPVNQIGKKGKAARIEHLLNKLDLSV